MDKEQEEFEKNVLATKLGSQKDKYKVLKRLLGTPSAQPPCLKRDVEGPYGENAGTLTMNPNEVDEITQRAWKDVYDGNVDDGKAHKAAFFKR